jgi:hypothetical protein
LELLVGGSTIRDPYVRLLTAAVGQKLASGHGENAKHASAMNETINHWEILRRSPY